MEPAKLLSMRVLLALGLLSALSLMLLLLRLATTGVFRYWFIPENLALAWLALFFGWILTVGLTKWRWLGWQNILLSILWLVFLPNSWYVLTDFLHVYSTGEISQLYDIAMIFCLVITGFILGIISLYLVHFEFLKRWPGYIGHLLAGAVLLVSSFGIHIGRDLRWNTWDIVANPGGLILNVSERIVSPLEHGRAVNVTILFFCLLVVIYAAWWIAVGPHKIKKN